MISGCLRGTQGLAPNKQQLQEKNCPLTGRNLEQDQANGEKEEKS